MKVLIATCGGGGRSSLSALRALARARAHVTVGGDRFQGEAFYSRFCHERLSYPSPMADTEAFQQSLLHHLRRGEFDVLLPMSDYAQLAICQIRSEVQSYVRMPLVDNAAIACAQDKLQTLDLARNLGIRTPQTHVPANTDELEQVAAAIEYPCVLKPRSGAGARQTHVLQSADELVCCYEQLPRENDLLYDYRPLIQSFVPGTVHDVCTLFSEGEPRALVTQARLRMQPCIGGIGIDNITTDEGDLKDLAVQLLRELRWHGVAQVEFKRDSRDGAPTLLEINPRFWGTLDLAVQAGVNFPLLAARLAMDGDVPPCSQYRVGLRYRWLQASSGWSFWNLLRPQRNSRTDFRWYDPLPQLYLLGTWLNRGAKRR